MKEYNEVVDAFCGLTKETKQKEIKKELQELLTVLHALCIEKDTSSNLLLHEEMNDYEKNNSDDEFLNSVYSYILSVKESLGKYFSE